MFGQIQLENFKEADLPQEAASAWTALEGLVGASYKPLLYMGKQVVNGEDYFFLAEQTLLTLPMIRRVVSLTINGRDGKFSLVPESVEVILQ